MPDFHNKHHQHCHLHFQARFLAALVLPWCFLVTPQVTALSPPSCGSGLMIICSSTTWTLMMMTSFLVIFCIRGTSSDPFYSLDRRDGGSKHWTSDPWKGRATFRFRSSPSSLSLYLAYCYRHHVADQNCYGFNWPLFRFAAIAATRFAAFKSTYRCYQHDHDDDHHHHYHHHIIIISFEPTGSALHLGHLEEGDGGVYRCQVDYSQVILMMVLQY